MLFDVVVEARIWCEDMAKRHESGSFGSQDADTDMRCNSWYERHDTVGFYCICMLCHKT